MAYNTDLFDLIKSMSATEKAYFKKYGYKQNTAEKQTGSNPYLKLFDAIDKQTAYNEEKLLKQFAKEKMVNNFSATKSYLYNLVLESLVQYNAGKSNTDFILGLLREIDLLAQKGLQKQYLKKIELALKKAEQFEYRILQVYLLNKQLEVTNFYSLTHENKHKELAQQITNTLLLLEHDNQWTTLSIDFYQQWRQVGMVARTDQHTDKLQKMLQEADLLQNPDAAKTTAAKIIYLNIHILYNAFLNNTQQVLELLLHVAAIFELNPSILEDRFVEYLYFLNMELGILMGLEKWAEFDANTAKFEQLMHRYGAKLTKEAETLYLNDLYIMQITRCYKTACYEQALPFTNSIRQLHPLLVNYPHHLAHNLFCIARNYFFLNQYTPALNAINEALAIKETENFPDIYAAIRVLNLLVHLELGNDQLLEYTLRSTYRFLNSRQRLFQVENIFLHFLKKLIDAPSKKATQQLYQQLYDQLTHAITADSKEHTALRLLDLRRWAQQKTFIN